MIILFQEFFLLFSLSLSPLVGFDPSALAPEGMHGLPGLAYYSGPVDPKVGNDKVGGGGGSTSKDSKKEKKGRATFSGNQIDELEKIFSTNQYLTNQERHNLAERLSLSENQVKIWFQNRRTKCRRTSWKRPSSMTSPTTPTAPVSFSSTPTTPTQQNPPNIPSTTSQ